MKATELRIGNFIRENDPNNNEPFQVWGTYDEKGNSKINYFPEAIFNPVPLTKEWFLKFGFEKIKDGKSYCADGKFTIKSKYFTVFKKGLITYNSIHGWYLDKKHFELDIKYIHQLQNLYFALTGEELEIKL